MDSVDWTKDTYSLDYLRSAADMFDWFESMHTHSLTQYEAERSHQSMLQFLVYAEVIPEGVRWSRGNAIPKTNLDRQRIPAGYLAEVAFDYDKDGFSTASDFINMLEFEVAGTASNDVLGEVMADLGRDS